MPEQIGVFLLFIAFVIFNLIAGAVNRRRQRAAAEKETQPPPPRAPVPLTLPPRVIVRPPSIAEAAPPTPVVVRRPPTRGRVPVQGKRRLELRRDELRRAIVLMTVLGPPRALEHEAKEGGGGR
jgi:hypothetical protein